MIKEDYVSFEIANLLKEKGFIENTICKYASVGGITEKWYDDYRERVVSFDFDEGYLIEPSIEPKDKYEIIGDTISAPTLQIVRKWLRKVYAIDIVITPSMFHKKYNVCIYKDENLCCVDFDGATLSPSYEYACEAAIKYCLENLI